MRVPDCSAKRERRTGGRGALFAATLATCLLPSAAAGQSMVVELEARVNQALEAARNTLEAETDRLDALATQHSNRTLPTGHYSRAQAAANIRLLERYIREQEAEEGRLLAQLEAELARLGPEIARLARRLSPAVVPPPAVVTGQSAAEFELRVNQALDAARQALVAEESRLDELAVHNSTIPLPDGRHSSAQAAAGIRLWDNAIREQKATEAERLAQLAQVLARLDPEVTRLAQRLSGPGTKPPLPAPGEQLPDPIRGDQARDPIPTTARCPESDTTEPRQPLRRESSALYRRVLSLPGAVMRPQPEAADATEAEDLPTFSVFYVYAVCAVDGETWLRVGRSIQRGADGWVAARATEEWRNMLVMQFPDRVNRGRVLFFDAEERVRALLDSFRRERDVAALHQRLERAGAAASIDGLVAVEPAEAIAVDAKPYLMPILDWREDVLVLDTGDVTTLVQVAGLNAGAGTESGGSAEPDLSELDIGIAFVIDTTRSMGPYLRATQDAVLDFARDIMRDDWGHRVDFALVGYRDDTAPNPGIEYVTRVYRDFGGIFDLEAFERDIESARISRASTRDWREDAFAGLRTAMEALSWSPMETRVIVLITDAGARSGSDPRASNARYDALNVREDARRRDIAIIPIHLLTPESARSDDTERAREQYTRISTTAEGSNYIPLVMENEDAFRQELRAMMVNLRAQIARLGRGEAVEPVAEDRILSESDQAAMEAFLIEQLDQASRPPTSDAGSSGTPASGEEGESARMPPLVAHVKNQIFRAQLQFMGQARGTTLPPFYRAWAADLDLANPRYPALDVRVFLNRSQLDALAQSLDRLLEAARRAGMSSDALMDALRHLSASMSTDPNLRTARSVEDGTIGDLLPDFLRELPYRSNLFALGLADFANVSMQAETIEQLGYKLEQYRRINGDRAGWLDLGSGDDGESVYPIPLRLLP